MIIANSVSELRLAIELWRKKSERIVFVPTMGNLHAGHLKLMQVAQLHGTKVIASIYVNPMQFDQQNDFAKYPRSLDDDLDLLREKNVDLVFVPATKDMYPRPLNAMTHVHVPELGDSLEGASRPGHFRGVTTVVARLFSLVGPSVAVFGKKDYQQLLIIKRMVEDLGMPVEIVGESTIREADGLAMSSRNNLLSADERKIAPRLYETLQACRSQIMQEKSAFAALEDSARGKLKEVGFVPDYVQIRRQHDLLPPEKDDTELVIVSAAVLGKIRLIDNLELSLNRSD